jgi:regulator of sigma E protease
MSWIDLVVGAAGIGIMVFVHELGHFVAARLSGVEVEVLSLGWGPRLIGFKRGGTWYQISWLLIGGYCKMKGELVPAIAGGGAEAVARAGSTGTVPAEPAARSGSFLSASPLHRIMISAFGPLFNLVFAFLVFAVIWWAGFQVPSSDNRVVLATDYTLDTFDQAPPATVAGLRTGDRITGVDGHTVEKFQDILELVSGSPGKVLSITVQRASSGASETLRMTPQLDKNTGAGRIGIYAWVDPVVASVAPASGAAIAGLQAGDRIVQAGGRPILNTMDLLQAIAAKPPKLPVTLERAGTRRDATLVFSYNDKGSPNLGLAFAYQVYRSPRLGPAGAVARSLEETWSTIAMTVKGIGLLFRGVNLRSAVMGPLGIMQLIGSASTSSLVMGVGAGAVTFFRLLALLSVVLFLMNLLPIPAMDGGQIILFAVEAARGRPVSTRVIWRLQLAGFSILILLFVFASLNDVGRWMGR